jgi:tetratricopeptide (TPR) repeat protein
MKRHREPSPGFRLTALNPLWFVIGLIVLTIAVFWETQNVGLYLDNAEIILQDPRVHTVSATQLHRILTQQYWETAATGLYRPLTTLTYLLNYAVLGNAGNPSGYHWINLLLHVANMALLYALGLAIFEHAGMALLLSALWGLHPVQTEAVTNVVGRADLLATFGILAALMAYRKVLDSTGARRIAWLAAVFLSASIGAFSKENGIVVIAVLVLYDVVFARQASWANRIAGYVAAAIPCAAYLYARAQVLASAPVLGTAYCDNPLLGASFWSARLTAVKVFGKYLLLLLWPGTLSWDYSYNQVPLFGSGGFEDMKAILSLIVLVAVAVAAFRSWRRNKPVFFAIAFFALTFAPVSNLLMLIGSVMGERFLYLPSIGFAACLAYVLFAAWERWNGRVGNYGAAVLLAILLGYTARTYARNSDWLDQSRFWRTGAEASPASWKTHMAVANSTPGLTPDDFDRGVREAVHALTILDPLPDDKNVGRAYRDAGVLYRDVGDRLAANQSAGLVAAGSTPQFWYQKALAGFLRSERIETVFERQYQAENARHGRTGLSAMPSKLYLELGRAYVRLKDLQHALSAFERGRVLESDPALLEELAAIYQEMGDLHKAAIALAESYTVDSNRPVLPKLVQLYGQIDPAGCSLAHDAGGTAINPDCPAVHKDICDASANIEATYLRRGQPFEAGAVHKRAVEYLGCK